FMLSPLHNPANLAGIEASMAAMPQTPQVAVFDTAFFADMPRRAWMYAVPYEWYEKYRVRKFGFHGTSHRYVTNRAAELLGKPVQQVNLITCHLGNGCSMTAVQGGMAVEHSMGMTPLAGLVMGTRSGDIDPAVVFYLINVIGMAPAEVDTALNKASGLLGVSGVGNDMRDCIKAATNGNERAKLAVELFTYRIIRYIGSYFAVLPASDAIVFTGGIGENSLSTRATVCTGLGSLGVRLDETLNELTRGGKEGPISSQQSKVPVWVIPTDEELMIARDTGRIVGGP
ncbi:MAG: acetate kinase, partial [Planctomycetes bacterium]|nr:acetate kinase [Planctomycetota bacterium]